MKISEKQLVGLIKESVKKVLEEADRHRPGYYAEYNKKRKEQGKPVDRHRPGYYDEYAKTHPEWAAKHQDKLSTNKSVETQKKKKNKNTSKKRDFRKLDWFDRFINRRDAMLHGDYQDIAKEYYNRNYDELTDSQKYDVRNTYDELHPYEGDFYEDDY